MHNIVIKKLRGEVVVPDGTQMRITERGKTRVSECRYIDKTHFMVGMKCFAQADFIRYIKENGLKIAVLVNGIWNNL